MGQHTESITRKELYMGIDVGGTKIAAAVLEPAGRIVWKTRTATEIAFEEVLLTQIDELVLQGLTYCSSERAGDAIVGVGIGVPGSVDRERGIALRASNLPWKDAPIKSRIERRYSLPVYLENDTNAGALGELWFGEWGEIRDFVYIALGTGVGSGVVINRRLYCGTGKAGEVGHIIVDPDGPQCKCGTRGCLETLVSAPAIAARARAAIRGGRPTMMAAACTSGPDALTAAQVSRAAWSGDPLALELMTGVARDLAIGLIAVFRLLDPELVILGGGVAAAGERLAEIVGYEMASLNGDCSQYAGRLALSKLGQDSGVVGAAAVVRDRLAGQSA